MVRICQGSELVAMIAQVKFSTLPWLAVTMPQSKLVVLICATKSSSSSLRFNTFPLSSSTKCYKEVVVVRTPARCFKDSRSHSPSNSIKIRNIYSTNSLKMLLLCRPVLIKSSFMPSPYQMSQWIWGWWTRTSFSKFQLRQKHQPSGG